MIRLNILTRLNILVLVCLVLLVDQTNGWWNKTKKVVQHVQQVKEIVEVVQEVIEDKEEPQMLSHVQKFQRSIKFPQAEQIVEEAGYQLERFHVNTYDHYNLEIWRIPGKLPQVESNLKRRLQTSITEQSEEQVDSYEKDPLENISESIPVEDIEDDQNQEDDTSFVKEQIEAAKKPVVLLWHGMMSSAVTFLNNEKESLAYQLSDAGYDVWLGNSRGSGMSQQPHDIFHLGSQAKEYWQFTWGDIAKNDVPATVKFILQKTGQEKLSYVGHSMGSTQMFAALSQDGPHREFLSEHVNLFVALGPVVYMDNVQGSLKFVSQFTDQIEDISDLISLHELGNWQEYGNDIQHKLAYLQSRLRGQSNSYVDMFLKEHTSVLHQNSMDLLSEFIYFWQESILGITAYDNLKVAFPHDMPAGMKTAIHYGQMMHSGKFQEFDYGTVKNLYKYGQTNAPVMDPSVITVPMVLVSSLHDNLSTVQDVAKLVDVLGGVADLVSDEDLYEAGEDDAQGDLEDASSKVLLDHIMINGSHGTFLQAKDMSWFQEKVLPIINQQNNLIQ